MKKFIVCLCVIFTTACFAGTLSADTAKHLTKLMQDKPQVDGVRTEFSSSEILGVDHTVVNTYVTTPNYGEVINNVDKIKYGPRTAPLPVCPIADFIKQGNSELLTVENGYVACALGYTITRQYTYGDFNVIEISKQPPLVKSLIGHNRKTGVLGEINLPEYNRFKEAIEFVPVSSLLMDCSTETLCFRLSEAEITSAKELLNAVSSEQVRNELSSACEELDSFARGYGHYIREKLLTCQLSQLASEYSN